MVVQTRQVGLQQQGRGLADVHDCGLGSFQTPPEHGKVEWRALATELSSLASLLAFAKLTLLRTTEQNKRVLSVGSCACN